MWVWRHRYRELGARADVDYVFIFENRGVEVGVTLHHPHGQIYGYPFLPPVPALELAADERLGGCAPCALLRARARGRRGGSSTRTTRSSPTCPTPRAGPTKRTWRCASTAPSLLECEPDELRLLADGPAGARARLRRAVRAALPLRDGGAPGAHRRGARRAPARRVLPAAAHRREAQVPGRLRAGRRARSSPTRCPRSPPRRCARRSPVPRERSARVRARAAST